MSSRTKATIALLAVPGAIVKIVAVVGAGASILPVIGPYLLGWAALSTSFTLGMVASDIIKSKRRREWTNAAGQVIESSLLERQELRHAQNKFDKLSARAAHDGQSHQGEAVKLADVFRKYADKAVVKQDVPQGPGRFGYVFGKTVFS